MMTNKPFGMLYTGVTADIATRMTAHREGRGSSFCQKWGLTRLVMLEWHDDIQVAIAREKAIKHWLRLWKLRFVSERNPNWDDLYDTLNA